MRPNPTLCLRSALLALVLASCTSDGALGPEKSTPTVHADVASGPRIVITELMPDPTKVADGSGEWFEVYNAGSESIDLKGYRIVSAAGATSTESHTIAADVVVDPGEYAVFGNNGNSATNGGVAVDYSYGSSIALNNGSSTSATEWLAIRTPSTAVPQATLDSVAYAARATPTSAPGAYTPPSGASRGVIDPLLEHTVISGTNWVTSVSVYGPGDKGTPGQPNVGGAPVSVSARISWVTPTTTFKISASAVDKDGKPSPTNFTWSVDNPAIATIDPVTGVATGVSLGVATVTATAANGVSGTAPLFVVNPGDVASISISTNDPALVPAGFTMPAFPTSKTTAGATVTPALVWSSNDPSVATVSALGYITGVGVGKTTIRATAPDGVYGEVLVSVESATAPTDAVYGNHLEFGEPHHPGAPNDPIILTKPQYVLSYNAARGGPNWVSWDLNASQFGGAPRCNCFSADVTLPTDVYHVVDFDYRNGGYDRGHMVQSESRTTTDQENAATFLLTNILPQGAENNQGPWSKFENYLNDLARTSNKEIYVVAGGIYAANPGTLKDEGKVAIPDYTWKVAVVVPAGKGLADVHSASDLQVIAIKMPNLTTPGVAATSVGMRNNPWEQYQVTVHQIETETGYDLLDKLPDDVEVLVENNDKAPVAAAGGPYAGSEGSAIAFDASASADPDVGDALTYAWDFGDGSTGSGVAPTHTYADNGTYVVTVKATDGAGASSTATTQAVVANVAPTGTLTAAGPFVEGSSFTLSLAGADVSSIDAASLTYAFDCGDGAGFGAASTTAQATCATVDNGTRTVRGRVLDKDGGAFETTASVTVANVAPVVTGLTVTADPVAVGTPVTVSATFTDAGTADTHLNTKFAWDDGVLSSSNVTESNGSGSAAASRTFTQAGVYGVTVTVVDDDGGQATQTSQQYVVVYDPTAGFVTGGGWIASPAGAYAIDPTLARKASFGFVARYQRGATTPSGNTEFQFHEGSFGFSSSSYQWLVVAGDGRAQYKGTGTVAGRPGSYGFLLTAVDDPAGDRFRIKIWDVATGTTLYDNQTASSDQSYDATVIGGGSIVIHTR